MGTAARLEGVPTLAEPGSGEGRPTLADGPASTAAVSASGEWAVGEVVAGLYEVREVFRSGGTGLVYRVWHRGWNHELAVKSPRPEALARAGGAEAFVHEAETWMDLGLHPHIVSCHYVRTIDEVPRVFAEYVNGGSLEEWIDDGRLYDGGPAGVLGRMLDVAAQMAWGLAYAHRDYPNRRGLAHRDVKPANVLLSSGGVAKVTDFGLAGARPGRTVVVADPEGRDRRVSTAWLSPQFCSPEQAQRARMAAAGAEHEEWPAVGAPSDVWSWALSVLAMFNGGVTWQALGAVVAPHLLADLVRKGPQPGLPTIPPELAEILDGCLERDPAARPADLDEIAGRLGGLYEQATGTAYPRRDPGQIDLRADSLNNRALSMLDLDRPDRAETAWQEALQADPHHPEATYNLGLIQWRRGDITDLEIVARLEEVRSSQDDSRTGRLLGLVHLERGDVNRARWFLERARETDPDVAQSMVAPTATDQEGVRMLKQVFDSSPYCAAVSSEGRRFATAGSRIVAVRHLDPPASEPLPIDAFEGDVRSLVFTGNGRWLVSGGDDGVVRVWDAESGACTHSLEGHEDRVWCVAASGDGHLVVSGDDRGVVRVWDTRSDTCVHTLQAHEGRVSCVAMSENGTLIASGGGEGAVRVWDSVTGTCMRSFEGRGHAEDLDRVNCLAINAELQRLVFASGRDTVEVWDTATWELARRWLTGLTSACIAVSSDARWLITGDLDGKLYLWIPDRGSRLCTWDGHEPTFSRPAFILGLQMSPDGLWAVSWAYDDTTKLWSLGGQRPAVPFSLVAPQTTEALFAAAKAFDEALAAARAAISDFRYREAQEALDKARQVTGYTRHAGILGLRPRIGQGGRRVQLSDAWHVRMIEHDDTVSSVALADGGRRIVSGCSDGTVRVWDREAGACAKVLEGHSGAVTSVAASASGDRVVSGSSDGTVRIWDAPTERVSHVLKHRTGVNAVALAPDAQWLVSSTADGEIHAWSAVRGQDLGIVGRHADRAGCVAIGPDGAWVVSGGYDDVVRMWNVQTKDARTFDLHPRPIEFVAMSPDGGSVLSGSRSEPLYDWDDDDVCVWQLPTGTRLRRVGVRGVQLTGAFLPEERWIVTGGEDGTLSVWDLSVNGLAKGLPGHTRAVNDIAITPDGTILATASSDRRVGVWYLDWHFEFPQPADWDVGARAYLETFLTLHMPYAASLPAHRKPTGKQVRLALTRRGRPVWTEEDFDHLLYTLGCAGYGWLRPEGVRRKLYELAAARAENKPWSARLRCHTRARSGGRHSS